MTPRLSQLSRPVWKSLAPLVLSLSTHGLQAQDVAAGKAVFAACAACHSINGGHGIGPSLGGISGRRAGSVPGFEYSRAMKNNPVVWDAASLHVYLSDPHGLVPGNLMPFAGLTDAAQRAHLVAYLLSLPPTGIAHRTPPGFLARRPGGE